MTWELQALLLSGCCILGSAAVAAVVKRQRFCISVADILAGTAGGTLTIALASSAWAQGRLLPFPDEHHVLQNLALAIQKHTVFAAVCGTVLFRFVIHKTLGEPPEGL